MGRSKRKSRRKQKSFSLFSLEPHPTLDINGLCPTMLKHCNHITENDGIMVLQNLIHNTYNIIIVSEMATMNVRFEFRKQEVFR